MTDADTIPRRRPMNTALTNGEAPRVVEICDEDALRQWRKFAAEHGYDVNDQEKRFAFGGGYLAGYAKADQRGMEVMEIMARELA